MATDDRKDGREKTIGFKVKHLKSFLCNVFQYEISQSQLLKREQTRASMIEVITLRRKAAHFFFFCVIFLGHLGHGIFCCSFRVAG